MTSAEGGGSVARCHDREATIVGTSGRDHITVEDEQRDQVVAALGGRDRIEDLGENTLACGHRGRDRLLATLDILIGTTRYFGGRGADFVGSGSDPDLAGAQVPLRLSGGPGDDLLAPGEYDDVVRGGPGDDVASIGGGNALWGYGRDRVSGGGGDDEINGGWVATTSRVTGEPTSSRAASALTSPMAAPATTVAGPRSSGAARREMGGHDEAHCEEERELP